MSSREELKQRLAEKLVGVYRVALRLCLASCTQTKQRPNSHIIDCRLSVYFDLCRNAGVPHQDLVTIALQEKEAHSLTEGAKLLRSRHEAAE